MPNPRYRIRFTKKGDLRWCSHRDLARAWERLLRRADLELALSEGFHPKPKISFPSALALGIASLEEYVEIELKNEIDPIALRQRIAAETLAGLEILDIDLLPMGVPKARMEYGQYEVQLPQDLLPDVQNRIDRLYQVGWLEFDREGVRSRTMIGLGGVELEVFSSGLRFKLYSSPSAAIRPAEILQSLELQDWLYQGDGLQRTRVVLAQTNHRSRVEEDDCSDGTENEFIHSQNAQEGNGNL